MGPLLAHHTVLEGNQAAPPRVSRDPFLLEPSETTWLTFSTDAGARSTRRNATTTFVSPLSPFQTPYKRSHRFPSLVDGLRPHRDRPQAPARRTATPPPRMVHTERLREGAAQAGPSFSRFLDVHEPFSCFLPRTANPPVRANLLGAQVLPPSPLNSLLRVPPLRLLRHLFLLLVSCPHPSKHRHTRQHRLHRFVLALFCALDLSLSFAIGRYDSPRSVATEKGTAHCGCSASAEAESVEEGAGVAG